MKCANCGSDEGFKLMKGSGVDPETGYIDDDFYVCLACEAAFEEEQQEQQCDCGLKVCRLHGCQGFK